MRLSKISGKVRLVQSRDKKTRVDNYMYCAMYAGVGSGVSNDLTIDDALLYSVERKKRAKATQFDSTRIASHPKTLE